MKHMRKGSITIFLALILGLMVTLLGAGLYSVRMQAARSQILNATDIGLFSLFSEFDRTLLDEYDLFALDASGGGSGPDLATLYDEFNSYFLPILAQNSQHLTLLSGGLNGYTLLTDDGGEALYRQVTQYMLQTIGAQGISAVRDRLSGHQESTAAAEISGQRLENEGTMGSYDREIQDAADLSEARARELREQNQGSDGSGTDLGSSSQGWDVSHDQQVENPIPVIQRIRQMGILGLVIPASRGISGESVNRSELPSGRALAHGYGLGPGKQGLSIPFSEILFIQYIMNKLGNYRRPAASGLRYQVEYIIGGRTTDRDNLEKVATRLLLIREGVNAAALAADSDKMLQVRLLASAIAGGFLVPPATPAIEAALVMSWAFAESVLDVRELFDGGRVPLIKDPASWQLTLENLPRLLDRLDVDRKNNDRGMAYQDYLQVLLMARTKNQLKAGTLDMLEQTLRARPGWETFRLDECVVAAGVCVSVRANGPKAYMCERSFYY